MRDRATKTQHREKSYFLKQETSLVAYLKKKLIVVAYLSGFKPVNKGNCTYHGICNQISTIAKSEQDVRYEK